MSQFLNTKDLAWGYFLGKWEDFFSKKSSWSAFVWVRQAAHPQPYAALPPHCSEQHHFVRVTQRHGHHEKYPLLLQKQLLMMPNTRFYQQWNKYYWSSSLKKNPNPTLTGQQWQLKNTLFTWFNSCFYISIYVLPYNIQHTIYKIA